MQNVFIFVFSLKLLGLQLKLYLVNGHYRNVVKPPTLSDNGDTMTFGFVSAWIFSAASMTIRAQ